MYSHLVLAPPRQRFPCTQERGGGAVMATIVCSRRKQPAWESQENFPFQMPMAGNCRVLSPLKDGQVLHHVKARVRHQSKTGYISFRELGNASPFQDYGSQFQGIVPISNYHGSQLFYKLPQKQWEIQKFGQGSCYSSTKKSVFAHAGRGIRQKIPHKVKCNSLAIRPRAILHENQKPSIMVGEKSTSGYP